MNVNPGAGPLLVPVPVLTTTTFAEPRYVVLASVFMIYLGFVATSCYDRTFDIPGLTGFKARSHREAEFPAMFSFQNQSGRDN